MQRFGEAPKCMGSGTWSQGHPSALFPYKGLSFDTGLGWPSASVDLAWACGNSSDGQAPPHSMYPDTFRGIPWDSLEPCSCDPGKQDEYYELTLRTTCLLCPMSESPSGKREDLHDNATRKGREIYCWLESGPLLQPTQWCKVREPRAPVSTHIYRVLNFKHKQWVVITSRLVTCLRSNFIGQTHFKIFARQGTFPEVYWAPADWLVSGGLLRVDNYPTLGRNWNLGLLIVQDACHGASYAHLTILKFFPNIPFFFLF